jgi:hypothetical protein
MFATFRPDPGHSFDVARVVQAARIDALVAATLGKACDPRGAFITRTDVDEKWWPVWREAYAEQFETVCDANRRSK